MGIKDQLMKIKDNWLIAVVLIALLLFLSGGSSMLYGLQSAVRGGMQMTESAGYDMDMVKSAYYPGYDSGFAPEVTERVKIVTANLATEVERGEFQQNADLMKSIVTAADGFILKENVYRYGEGWKESFSGSYTIKVDTAKYDAVIRQLREIGEVQSFSRNENDVTGQYTDLQTELDAEKSRLEMYRDMLDEAKSTEDRINLADRIFSQEKTVAYLEKRIENMDQRVDYSTVHMTISEKRSDWTDIGFVKLSELVKSFVRSAANLFKLVFVLVPWAIAALLICFVYRAVRKRR